MIKACYEWFAGLDGPVRRTSIYVMEAGGKILKEGKVESHPLFFGGCGGYADKVSISADQSGRNNKS